MAQILFRYVFEISAPWTEEAARYLMIWMALLASGLAFQNGDHFNIDFLTSRMGPRLQVSLSLWMSLLAVLFILSIILWGIPFAMLGFFTTAPGLQITMFLPYLAVPVGGVLMLLNLICFILRLVKETGRGGSGRAMTLLFVSLVLVVLLLALGQSIAVTMGVTGMVYFLLTNGFDYFPMVVTRIFKGMDSFVFICVPLYILAGDLMNCHGPDGPAGPMGRKRSWESFPGGWPRPSSWPRRSSAGSAGAPWATSPPWGRSSSPTFKRRATARISPAPSPRPRRWWIPIIPPSIIIVIYAAVMNTSIGAMYAAAIIPGLLAHPGRHGDRPLPGQEAKLPPTDRSRSRSGNWRSGPGMPPWP